MRLLAILGSVLVIFLAAGCGSSSSSGSTVTEAAGGGQSIAVSEAEFTIDPSSLHMNASGTVTLRVTNNGSIPHALEVEGNGVEEETEPIEPGDTAELTVDLSKEGSYEIYCPIDGHRDKGMEGTLVVGAGGGAGTDTTEDEDDGSPTSGGGYGYGSG